MKSTQPAHQGWAGFQLRGGEGGFDTALWLNPSHLKKGSIDRPPKILTRLAGVDPDPKSDKK